MGPLDLRFRIQFGNGYGVAIDNIDFDQVPDTRPRFRRGDSNDDGEVDVSDAITTLGVLFLGDGEITCRDAADANDNGEVDLSDAINTLGVVFLGDGTIPAPGMNACGVDPTDDGLGCDVYHSTSCP